jgi:hypothetical protein
MENIRKRSWDNRGLWIWTVTPRGFVRMAVCQNCRHMAPLPIRELVQRFGQQYPIELAIRRLRCESCGQRKVEAQLMPLCQPGSRHRR